MATDGQIWAQAARAAGVRSCHGRGWWWCRRSGGGWWTCWSESRHPTGWTKAAVQMGFPVSFLGDQRRSWGPSSPVVGPAMMALRGSATAATRVPGGEVGWRDGRRRRARVTRHWHMGVPVRMCPLPHLPLSLATCRSSQLRRCSRWVVYCWTSVGGVPLVRSWPLWMVLGVPGVGRR